jgi:hypothetical protein
MGSQICAEAPTNARMSRRPTFAAAVCAHDPERVGGASFYAHAAPARCRGPSCRSVQRSAMGASERAAIHQRACSCCARMPPSPKLAPCPTADRGALCTLSLAALRTAPRSRRARRAHRWPSVRIAAQAASCESEREWRSPALATLRSAAFCAKERLTSSSSAAWAQRHRSATRVACSSGSTASSVRTRSSNGLPTRALV